MSSFLINIIATSNLGEKLRADTAELQKQNAALATNTALHGTAGTATAATTSKVQKDTAARTVNNAVLDKQQSKIWNVVRWMFHLDSAQRKVGYNISGFSIRVGAWFIPLMGMMYVSMLPVIGALIAMGSAALVAMGGLVGVLGVGALLLSHRHKKSQGMYAGARRPYANLQDQTGPFDVLMEPVWAALESAKLMDGSSASEYAVTKLTHFFKSDLPGAITSFLRGVDRAAMDTIMTMFSTWLPGAANGLAKWGGTLFKVIGPGSLSRFNNFFKWMAQGIMNVALWLEATDWKYFDQFTRLLSDVAGTLMQAGKNALPVFSAALDQIWPFPLKPMIQTLGGFFKVIGENEEALDILSRIIQVIVAFRALRYVAVLAGSLGLIKPILIGLGVTVATGIVAAVGIIILGLTRLLAGIIEFGLRIINTIGNLIRLVFGAILDAVFSTFGSDKFKGWRDVSIMGDDWMSSNLGLGPTAMAAWSDQFDQMMADTANWVKGKRNDVTLYIQSNDSHILDVVSGDVEVIESPVTAPQRGGGRPTSNTYLG